MGITIVRKVHIKNYLSSRLFMSLIANYENKIVFEKNFLPAPAAEIILTLSPKAILDEFFTCPACERDTIKIGVLLSFTCLTKIN